jgi:hypothetical protein
VAAEKKAEVPVKKTEEVKAAAPVEGEKVDVMEGKPATKGK